jgi:hypothetical protein
MPPASTAMRCRRSGRSPPRRRLTWVLVVLTLVGPPPPDPAATGPFSRPVHRRGAALADEVVALADLLEAAPHSGPAHPDGRLELTAARDLREERAPVDALRRRRGVVAGRAGAAGEDGERSTVATAERNHSDLQKALRTAPWTARHPIRAKAAWSHRHPRRPRFNLVASTPGVRPAVRCAARRRWSGPSPGRVCIPSRLLLASRGEGRS